MKNVLLVVILFVQSVHSFAIAPTVTGFSPASAASGMSVVITGTDFTGATAVSFGGSMAASFVVNSATQITAVVATAASGAVQVTTIDGPGAKTGFTYIATSAIITDFGGFWSSAAAAPNAVVPDNSHNLLSITYNDITYSTGVNDALLSAKGISYTAGNFKAFPVAGISGSVAATSTYLALAKKVDGSAAVANTANVAGVSLKTVLTDGLNGLDLGTGVTNLPATAVLNFQIFNIDPSKINDDEPDVLLTQIAQPVTGNDVFSFINASGVVVGNSLSQDMTLLPKFGTYDLDLFNLTPSTPYNSASVYSAFSVATNREIRLVGFRLADFGITLANAAQVKALRITPSGNSDYAFIAYNANALNLPPNVSANDALSNLAICSGGSINASVLTTATAGGALSYSWQESTNGGSSWLSVTDGGNYSGTLTSKLTVAGATAGYKYRAVVHEVGNSNDAVSPEFLVTVNSFTPPSTVVVSGGTTTCLNTPLQLTSAVTGGTNLNYQWQSDASGVYADIPGASLSNYAPPMNQTGIISYKLKVSSGNGCPGAIVSATPAIVTIGGIASATPAARCEAGAVTLSAVASAGTVDWYAADNGGTSLFTGSSFTTPSLSATKTYYVASSGCTAALRVPVIASVAPLTSGGIITGGTTVATGTNSTLLTLNGNTGSIVKWQASTDTFHSVINDVPLSQRVLIVSNLSENTQYRALIQSGTCAAAFSGIAYMNVSMALPVHSSSIRADRKNSTIVLQWTAYDQQSTDYYVIERSANGASFTEIGKAGMQRSGLYSWTDSQPMEGINYYRLKEVYFSGSVYLTRIVQATFSGTQTGMSVYPNPVTGRVFHLQMNVVPGAQYQAKLLNAAGQLCWRKTLAAEAMQSVVLPAGIKKGSYRLLVTGPDGVLHVNSIVIL